MRILSNRAKISGQGGFETNSGIGFGDPLRATDGASDIGAAIVFAKKLEQVDTASRAERISAIGPRRETFQRKIKPHMRFGAVFREHHQSLRQISTTPITLSVIGCLAINDEIEI
jgi:hypothetical protein